MTQQVSPDAVRELAPRLPVPPRPGATGRRTTWIVAVVVLVVLHVLAFIGTEFRPGLLVDGADGMASFLAEAVPPATDWQTVLRPALEATLVTLWIGLLGTTLSIPASLVLAVLGARTHSPHPVVQRLARAALSFLRAVPDVVFALIFVTAVGLGPFAGVLALICHNTGVMGKLWSEAMEESDAGPAEALRTVGARRSQVVAHATLPTVAPQWIGLLLYRFDVNVRSSLVLGLVGAGGIGLLINRAIKEFRFDVMMTDIIIVLVLVVVVDTVSGLVRRRMQV